MIGAPTDTVSPTPASSLWTFPETGLGSSTNDFAVSISTSTSLIRTSSPSETSHWVISASTRPSPGSGSLNSNIARPCQ